jgi:hypothetical protein
MEVWVDFPDLSSPSMTMNAPRDGGIGKVEIIPTAAHPIACSHCAPIYEVFAKVDLDSLLHRLIASTAGGSGSEHYCAIAAQAPAEIFAVVGLNREI